MSNEQAYRVTPKGYLCILLMKLGHSLAEGDEMWNQLQAYCMRRLKDEYPESEYAAVIFTGDGGEVIGVDPDN